VETTLPTPTFSAGSIIRNVGGMIRNWTQKPPNSKKNHQTPSTIWLFNSLPWKITMLLIGKPSISMGHLYHGYVK
jgi:hypothetical protein